MIFLYHTDYKGLFCYGNNGKIKYHKNEAGLCNHASNYNRKMQYGIQFLFKYYVLFDEFLKQSEERMADPEYVEQIKTYNKIKFGKEDWKN